MDVIHSYTRKQAIEDGVLVDVTQLADEAGLRYPTAVTAAVWGRYVQVPPGVACQDETGRLWDILWMLRCRINGSRDRGPQMLFQLNVRNDNTGTQRVELKAVCGPGDDAEPVITIMLPQED